MGKKKRGGKNNNNNKKNQAIVFGAKKTPLGAAILGGKGPDLGRRMRRIRKIMNEKVGDQPCSGSCCGAGAGFC